MRRRSEPLARPRDAITWLQSGGIERGGIGARGAFWKKISPRREIPLFLRAAELRQSRLLPRRPTVRQFNEPASRALDARSTQVPPLEGQHSSPDGASQERFNAWAEFMAISLIERGAGKTGALPAPGRNAGDDDLVLAFTDDRNEAVPIRPNGLAKLRDWVVDSRAGGCYRRADRWGFRYRGRSARPFAADIGPARGETTFDARFRRRRTRRRIRRQALPAEATVRSALVRSPVAALREWKFALVGAAWVTGRTLAVSRCDSLPESSTRRTWRLEPSASRNIPQVRIRKAFLLVVSRLRRWRRICDLAELPLPRT